MKDQDKLRENVSDLACQVASVAKNCHSVDVLKTVKKHMHAVCSYFTQSHQSS